MGDPSLRIVYLVPESGVSGGQKVAFAQARGLASRGHALTIVSPDSRPSWFDIGPARWEQAPFVESRELARAQVCVATFWTTVRPAIERCPGSVFHLCQGYEGAFTFYASARAQIREAYSLPARKLVVAPHISEQLAADGFVGGTWIGQAFDRSEFPPEASRRFDNPRPTALLVGPLEADVKGIAEALEAVRLARLRGAPLALHRISTLPQATSETMLGVTDRFDVALSTAEMAAAYRKADVLIGPSHAQEGFGLPVLEALSSGLPVLASDTAGHRHIAADAADYFAVGDARSLAARLEAILRDPARRRELSRRGPPEAARFDTRFVVDRLLEQFHSALG
jgi:glycosyltransferase involved in cell wall biosynthesis